MRATKSSRREALLGEVQPPIVDPNDESVHEHGDNVSLAIKPDDETKGARVATVLGVRGTGEPHDLTDSHRHPLSF